MKLLECMYAWDPETTRIRVGAWPDETGWSDAYEMTCGACMAAYHDMSPHQLGMMLFIDFNTIVVRDRVPAAAAHAAFLAIDEYRLLIAPDTQGAARDAQDPGP